MRWAINDLIIAISINNIFMMLEESNTPVFAGVSSLCYRQSVVRRSHRPSLS